MGTQVYINLPSADPEASRAFYVALGATINEDMTGENSLCAAFDDGVHIMLQRTATLQSFTTKTVIDPRTHVQTAVNFTRDSREAVDATVAAGIAAGGSEPTEPQDYGFMYSRDLDDPDGNALGFLFFDVAAADAEAVGEN